MNFSREGQLISVMKAPAQSACQIPHEQFMRRPGAANPASPGQPAHAEQKQAASEQPNHHAEPRSRDSSRSWLDPEGEQNLPKRPRVESRYHEHPCR
jgi:hypothetical protein